jgi:hypothetical protein
MPRNDEMTATATMEDGDPQTLPYAVVTQMPRKVATKKKGRRTKAQMQAQAALARAAKAKKAQQPKPRGWPKGKPRGPRKTVAVKRSYSLGRSMPSGANTEILQTLENAHTLLGGKETRQILRETVEKRQPGFSTDLMVAVAERFLDQLDRAR